jgi:alkylated DNA repair dioxygenase AlkB
MDLFSSILTELESIKLNMVDADIEYFPSFFTQSESNRLYKSLLKNIAWQQDTIRFYGKEIPLPRLTAWYGETDKSYTYSGIPMKPLAWTDELLEIKYRIEEIACVEFSSVLLNLYRTGNDSVAWHADDEKELGHNPIIGSVSFGAARTFQFKHIENPNLKEKIELQNGSFLLMRGETQHNWLHQIPKTTKPLQPRINLTFRIIR